MKLVAVLVMLAGFVVAPVWGAPRSEPGRTRRRTLVGYTNGDLGER